MKNKMIYVLDFDGVICDSQNELAITGWRAAQKLWPDMANKTLSDALLKDYFELRPIVETGYEVILIMRLLASSFTANRIRSDYSNSLAQLIESENFALDTLKHSLTKAREQWIDNDCEDWLQKSPLYPGIKQSLDRLRGKIWYVATTKQERYVKLILEHNKIVLPDEHIFGLDRKKSKEDILLQLITRHQQSQITFIEDRLPTLERISRIPKLQTIRLQLADWGYNSEEERHSTKNTTVRCIGIEQFIETLADR